MGCGSSTQIGATDNPTSADEHDENGTNAGTNSVDGQVVDVEGKNQRFQRIFWSFLDDLKSFENEQDIFSSLLKVQ